MSGDANNVIATRNFIIYEKAYDSANAVPADTVSYGTPWTGYTDVGYSSGGLSFDAKATYGNIEVDQEFFPVAQPLQSVDLTMGAQLAEFTPANVQRAMSGLGTLTTVAAASGTRGNNELVINNTLDPTANSWGFDIQAPDGEAMRLFMRRARATGSISSKVVPNAATTIGLEVTALVDSSDGQIAVIHDVIPALP